MEELIWIKLAEIGNQTTEGILTIRDWTNTSKYVQGWIWWTRDTVHHSVVIFFPAGIGIRVAQGWSSHLLSSWKPLIINTYSCNNGFQPLLLHPMSSNETSILIELRWSCWESKVAIRHRSQLHPMTRGDDISILSNFQLQRLPRAHCNPIAIFRSGSGAGRLGEAHQRSVHCQWDQGGGGQGKNWLRLVKIEKQQWDFLRQNAHTFFGKDFVNATRCCSFWNPPRWLRWCWSGYRLVTLEKSLILGSNFFMNTLLGIWSAWQRVFRLAEICWADWIHVDLAPNLKKSAHKMNRACLK